MKLIVSSRWIYFWSTVLVSARLALGPMAVAQDQSSVSITATATVIKSPGIEMVTMKNMEIMMDLAVDGKIWIDPRESAQTGILLLKGSPFESFHLTYQPEVLLTNNRGYGELSFFYEVLGYPGDNQMAAEKLDAVERILQFNEDGEYYVWVGGRVDVSEAFAGSYSGEFIIEIEIL